MAMERDQDGGTPPQAMLTVAAVARRLGVAPSTLRTWDRRYGLGPSAHTAGSHRRYSPSDVSRLTIMRGLVMEGVPPGEAAQIAIGTPVEATEPGPTGAGEQDGGPPSGAPEVSGSAPPGEEPPRAAPARPGRSGRSGGGAVSRRATPQPVIALPLAPRSSWPRPVPPDAGSSAGPAASPVPASRGPRLPEGAGRAVWPVAPLAARHLVQGPVPGEFAGPPAPGAPAGPGPAPGPLPGMVPPGAVPSVARAAPAGGEVAADELDDGLDEVLAQVIAAALGRSEPPPESAWSTGRAPGRSGGGRVISLPDATPRARGLARAAMSLDTHELSRLLREAMGAYGVVGAWNTMILPVLHGLGERWRATGDGVDVEHAFCEATLGVLRGISATLYRPRNVRPVLLACADGDYHTLPLHVLAAALAEAEVGSRLLGAGLPSRALVAAVRRTGPSVIMLYARLPVRDTAVLRELPRQRPAPRLLVGGPGWDAADLPASAVRVGSLQDAVDEVLAALGP